MGRLTERVALVTGASRGIGRAIALALANEGAKVAVNYQRSDSKAQGVLDEIAQAGGTGFLAKANVGISNEARTMVGRVVELWGGIDILVNNAGITRDVSLKKMTDQQWDEVIQTNLNSCFYCTSASLPSMIDRGWGRIINISSLNGQVAAFGQANYSASKGGIISFTRTAALELARSNITVNAIAPGYMETDMFAQVPEKIQDKLKSQVPLGRFGTPDEVAQAVLYLVLHGDYVTGQQLNVNGGVLM